MVTSTSTPGSRETLGLLHLLQDNKRIAMLKSIAKKYG